MTPREETLIYTYALLQSNLLDFQKTKQCIQLHITSFMDHDAAVDFCVALCLLVHQHDHPETILEEIFDANNRNSIINYFEFLDNKQLKMIDNEEILEDMDHTIAALGNDFIELISFEIIRRSIDRSLTLAEKQSEVVMIINATGEMPEWFWTDFSMDIIQ